MNPLLKILQDDGQLDEETCIRIASAERQKPLSVFWHIRTILYLGISVLAGGLGILIYKHIDTIGHAAIVALIGLLCASCFFYCIKNIQPFTKAKAEPPGTAYDYVLLLGCLLFITFLGYLQWQYLVFGFRYGLATFVPACVLLLVAYRFDHLGILTLGITLFASWLGLTITPLQILSGNNFSSDRIIFTGAALALIFSATAYMQYKNDFKKHFVFTYMNFAVHLAGISCLSGLFFLSSVIWLPLFLLAIFGMQYYARLERSFYFLLMAVLYGSIGVIYLITRSIFIILPDAAAVYLVFMLYIGACAGIISFLRKIRKSFQKNDPV